MAAKFRPIFSVIALFLATLTLTGMALPMPGLWQCRHAAQWVVAAPDKSRGVMPCRMSGQPMTMAAMACCAKKFAPVRTPAQGHKTFGAAPCRPTFVPATTLPTASLGADSPLLSLSASSDVAALPPFTLGRWRAPHLTLSRPRPPPGDAPPPSARFRTPSLRAPPVA